MADRKTLEARFEYWGERLEEAHRAVETAHAQLHETLVALGELSVQEMIESGTLNGGSNE